MSAQVREDTKPQWRQTIIRKYTAAISHAFVLHHNTLDYPGGIAGANLLDYLFTDVIPEIESINDRRDVIVYWNRATGFVFPDDDLPDEKLRGRMRREFAKATGIVEQRQASSSGQTPQPTNSRAARMNSSVYAQRGGYQQQGGGATITPAQADAAAEALIDQKLEQAGRLPGTALPLLNKLLRYKKYALDDYQHKESLPFRVAVVVGYGDTLVPHDSSNSDEDRTSYVTLAEWGRDLSLGEKGHVLFMIVDELSWLDERLRRSGAKWEQIDIPYPDFEQRAAFLQELLAIDAQEVAEVRENGGELYPLALAEGVTCQDVARWTTGLGYIHIHDIVLRARDLETPVEFSLVKERKDEIIASEYHVLTQIESTHGFEKLGGLFLQKRFLRKEVVRPFRCGGNDLRRLPQGILFTGAAGTGKSEIARALAYECGVLFVELKPSKLLDMMVGNSEKLLERALGAIKTFAPAIVFVDEIDQFMRRGTGHDGDSGIQARFFKMLLEAIADPWNRGRILWVGATNEPRLLDPAVLRPGRFDKKVPFAVGTCEENADIIGVLMREIFGEVEGEVLPQAVIYKELADAMGRLHPSADTISSMIRQSYDLYAARRSEGWDIERVLRETCNQTLLSLRESEKARGKRITPDVMIAMMHAQVREIFGEVEGVMLPQAAIYKELAEEMDGYSSGVYYTAAEIAHVVKKALSLYFDYREDGWDVERALREGYDRTLPTTQDVDRMTTDALDFCSDLDLVPPQLREEIKKRKRPRKGGVLPDEDTNSAEHVTQSEEKVVGRRQRRVSRVPS